MATKETNSALCWLPILAGLIALPVLGYVTAYVFPGAKALEARLQAKSTTALSAIGADWAKVTMDGQTATVTGLAPTVEAEQAALRAVATAVGVGGFSFGGVTRVIDEVEVGAAAAPAQSAAPAAWNWLAERVGEAGVRLKGAVPSEEIRADILATANPLFPGGVEDQMTIGAGAPATDWLSAVKLGLPHFAKFGAGTFSFDGIKFGIAGEATDSTIDFMREDLGRLPGVGFDAAGVTIVAAKVEELASVDFSAADKDKACQDGFSLIMAENKILFKTGSAEIDRVSGGTLDKLLVVARECKDFSLDVIGHTDSVGSRASNIALSQKRADAVMGYLVSKGFPAAQLVAKGMGPDQPVASNATEDGKSANRRIDFVVRKEG